MMGDCRCPRCKVIHKMKLEKKLNIIPWFYCKLCIPKVKNKSSDIVQVVRFITSSESSHIGSE